jgi:hypothetical protein
MLRLVPYLVGALVLAVAAVILTYSWNMHIADAIFTDRCGFDTLGPDSAPTMTWVGCSE